MCISLCVRVVGGGCVAMHAYSRPVKLVGWQCSVDCASSQQCDAMCDQLDGAAAVPAPLRILSGSWCGLQFSSLYAVQPLESCADGHAHVYRLLAPSSKQSPWLCWCGVHAEMPG